MQQLLIYKRALAVGVLVFSSLALAKPPAAPGAAAPTGPQPSNMIMLRVNGEEITVQQYANYLSRLPSSTVDETRTPDGQARILRAMAGDLLLRSEMRRAGLLPNDGKEHREKLPQAYADFAAKHYPLPPPSDEKSARAYFEQNKTSFGLPEMVRVSQIQLRFPKHATAEQKLEVKNRAQQALNRLDSGESFDKVASEITENKLAKARGGDVGFLAREGDPWVVSAIKGLKVGQRTGVLESSVGYEILMLTDERPALVAPFEQMKEKVIQAMQAIEQGKAQEAYVQKLAKKAKIEIVQPDLKDVFPKGVFPR